MSISDSDRDPIELLASEFLARYRRREQPTVDEYVERHPELAAEIRDAFATLLAMEGLKQRKESDAPGGRATLGARQLKQLGDFRIEREIGRGGMGIVYEAIQESLHRRVALKVLPHAHFDERRVARFQREALTAANLNHPNIVPVFGVGEQDGIHYYVMQCIDGVGLDVSLAQAVTCPQAATIHKQETVAVGVGETDRMPPKGIAPLPRMKRGNAAAAALVDGKTGLPLFREIAQIGRQAAAALDYAHQQGVLHRDIKPSNLILDSRGNIWIADFGLAKAMESSNLSQTGELAGTLRYMAPERFQGESEPRSDVYSLGMTLYELLTRRPAFAAAQGQQLIDQITRGEPTAPRKVMPQIPRDLETIVLRAIAREPKRRYRTAGDLAADLERWLTFRPIHARRVSPPEQAWMWARRNPTVAGLSALVCVLLAIVLVMGGYDYWKTKQDATTTSRRLVVEEERRRRAEDTSERVVAALNGICDELTLASDGAPSPAAQLSREQMVALETMLPLQQQLAASTGGSPEVQRDAAVATRRVADIYRMLGRYQDAISTYGQARHKYLALERPPRSAALNLEIASLDNDLGLALRMMQRGPEAEVSYGRALELLKPLAESEPATDDVRYQLARTYCLLAQPPGLEAGPPPPPHDLRGGQYAGGRGRPPGGRPLGPGGRPNGPPPRRGPAGGPPPGPGRRGLGPPPGPPSGPFGPAAGPPSEDGRQRPGPEKHGGGLTDEQFEWFEQAIALLEPLHEAHPQQADYRHLLACAYRDQARGRVPREAERQLKQAEDLLVELANDYPDVAAYRLDLMATYVANEFADVTALRKALDLSNEFVQRYRQVPIYTVERVSILFRLGMMLHRDQREEEAAEALREAIVLVTPLVEKFPDVTAYKFWQGAGRMSLALILHHQGDEAQARELLEQTIWSLSEFATSDGTDPASGILRDAQGMLEDFSAEP